MQPNGLTTQTPPEQPLPPTEDSSTIEKANKSKLTWGLICLIGPTLLLVLSIIIYAIANFMMASASPESSSDMAGGQSPIHSAINIALFLVGAIVILTWLPGVIIGTVLLASRKPTPSKN